MPKTLKVALAGAGAFGLRHLDAIKADRRGRDDLAHRPRARQDQGRGGEIRRRACHDRSRRHPQAAGARCGHPGDADADARRAGAAVPRGRQACADRDPPRRQFDGRRSGGRGAEDDRARRHGRPYPPLQPEPSVRAPAHSERRVPYPADGRADVFLPPHQHERARAGALLDRSSALASRRAHGRPLRLPVPLANREGERAAGAHPSRRSASPWT